MAINLEINSNAFGDLFSRIWYNAVLGFVKRGRGVSLVPFSLRLKIEFVAFKMSEHTPL